MIMLHSVTMVGLCALTKNQNKFENIEKKWGYCACMFGTLPYPHLDSLVRLYSQSCTRPHERTHARIHVYIHICACAHTRTRRNTHTEAVHAVSINHVYRDGYFFHIYALRTWMTSDIYFYADYPYLNVAHAMHAPYICYSLPTDVYLLPQIISILRL